MKELKIEHLAYLLQEAKTRNQPQPIFFLGAGASKTGNIPLAREIITDILSRYPDSPFIVDIPDNQRTYAKLMDCLMPGQRNELLKGYINNAKINVTHIYLAQLLNEGYADYVMTVNFDNLMLRALAMFNIFPSTYDMAILKDLTTTTFKEKSVVYLHGQSHGLWLLNTQEEMDKVRTIVPRIFDTIKNQRPWIFIGYSGDDPIFEHVKNLGRFDNGLYWVTYYDDSPNESVMSFLSSPNTNAFLIKGYDSDSFMLKLNSLLKLQQPNIVNKPFSALKEILGGIVDIEDKEHFKGVRERMEVSLRQVNEVIKQYEEGITEPINEVIENTEVDLLKREIINLVISNKYENNTITDIEARVTKINNETLNNLLSDLYFHWGTSSGSLAETKSGDEADKLYEQAFDKFQKAIAIRPDHYQAITNWGNSLGRFAETKSGDEADRLYEQAFDKFQKALVIKPDKHEAFTNWGNFLGSLARTKSSPTADRLYEQAFEKFQKALTIKPDYSYAYNNWGGYLASLARTKSGTESERIYEQSFDKLQRVFAIKPDYDDAYYTWGYVLGSLAETKSGDEADRLYEQACDKLQRAVTINPNHYKAFTNLGIYLGRRARAKSGDEADRLYEQAFEKFQKALTINPNKLDIYNNQGIYLGYWADTKSGDEAIKLYEQACDKFQKEVAIKPDNYQAFTNWANALCFLAGTKLSPEADRLYEQAFEKLERAVAIKSDDHEIFFNWSIYLGSLAKTKSGDEADRLYEQAFEKLRKTLIIKPDKHEAYSNWGTYLGHLAKTKSGDEADRLYEQAFEKFERVIALNSSCYNYSCILALKGEKSRALYYLDLSLSKKEINVSFVRQDEDWKAYLQDEDFINVLNKYEQ